MYVNSGYLFNSRVPFKEEKRPLRILSAGTYQLHTWPKLPTWRPKGRIDWQLIYVAAGEGHFIFDGKEVRVPAGHMVLYPPKAEQHYYFLSEDTAQYWFVHFTGTQVKNILKHYELPLEERIIPTGLSYEYEEYFKKMRDELADCAWGYEENLTFLFRQLMIVINRRIHEGLPAETGFIRDEIERAKTYFREHYNENIRIHAYADSRNMSISWFSKNFTSIVGESPKQYILGLRLKNAQVLLETTDGTVSEIAQIVGYENPMYFSRIFHRAKGMSPTKYRSVYRETGMVR